MPQPIVTYDERLHTFVLITLPLAVRMVHTTSKPMCVLVKNLSVSPNITWLDDMMHANYMVLHKQSSHVSNNAYCKFCGTYQNRLWIETVETVL